MNDEILGGLKSALERGESLKRAMMTFYNSGYKKEEIEEAARAVNALGIQPIVVPVAKTPVPSSVPKQVQSVSTVQSPEPFSEVQFQAPSPSQNQQPVMVNQKVSNYGNKPKDKTLIFILVGVLVFLLGVLLSIFIFKDELIGFFSSLFA